MSNNYQTLAELFRALAHPARLQILDLLRNGEICVCHIEASLGKRQAYVSQQLMALREVGLVVCQKQGLQVYYRLADDTVARILDSVLEPAPNQHLSLNDCPCPSCKGEK